jgi:hypothetical protein
MEAGEVWAVPYMPRNQWVWQSEETWAAVHTALRKGWAGKVNDAQRLMKHSTFSPEVACAADDLGAPVGQMFTVVVLARRLGL